MQRAHGPKRGEILGPIDEHLKYIIVLRRQIDAVLKAEAEIGVVERGMGERPL